MEKLKENSEKVPRRRLGLYTLYSLTLSYCGLNMT